MPSTVNGHNLIADRLAELGRNQVWLGEQVAKRLGRDVPFSQSAVSNWLRHIADPQVVFAVEAVLELRPGTLSARYGYLPVGARPAVSVVDAIRADPELSEVAKRGLIAAYREWRKA